MFTNPTVSIDKKTCTHCKSCVDVCASGIYAVDADQNVVVNPEHFSICIVCGQCMMACPEKSAQVEGLNYDQDFFEYPGPADDFESLYRTMVRRRSVRSFKEKPVPEELLKKITDFLRFAPFGVDHDSAEITVINDRSLIEKGLPMMQNTYRGMAKMLKTALGRTFFRLILNPADRTTIMEHLLPLLKKKEFFDPLEKDWITRGAPAIMLFHAKKSAPEHVADCWINVNYAMVAAQYLGLGSTIIGLVPPVLNQSSQLKALYGIPKDHKVLASLILGYQKHKFFRGYQTKERIIHFSSFKSYED